MTDRPIMFSAPMVRALRADRKTQTRRLSTSPLRRARPGDQLWVRETFGMTVDGKPVYRADFDPFIESSMDADICRMGGKVPPWKPSIHMPRAVTRIALLVTDVRFMPLQDIPPSDAEAEGIAPYAFAGGKAISWNASSRTFSGLVWTDPVQAFRDLWVSINGEDSWDENPEVVALTFKRVNP